MPPALSAIQAAWNAAGRAWDPDALAAVYTEDALFFGGRPGHFIGRAAIRDYFASYVGVIEAGSMALVDQQVLALGPDSLLAQGHVDFAFVLAGGQATRSRLRTTLLIVRLEQQWRVRQHHFSPTPAVPPLGQDEHLSTSNGRPSCATKTSSSSVSTAIPTACCSPPSTAPR